MIALSLAAAFALPPQWNAWKTSAAIQTSAAVMQSVTVPPRIFGKTQTDLRDVRIIDAQGNEIPYAIVVRRGSQTVEWKEARLDDYGFVPGNYTQVVADAGTPREDYSAIDVSTPRANFATTVDVFASDDRLQWRRIREAAPLFDYQADGLGSNTRIALSPSHARYYRIYVRDRTGAFPIDAVRFAEGKAALPELVRYADVGLTRREKASDTLLLADAHYVHIPVSFVRVDTSTPRFSRNATLEASDDGKTWSFIDTETLERTPASEHRALSFDETQARYWRLRIANGNDKPLSDVRIELWGAPRHVVFAAGPQRAYRLVYGSADAPEPVYDFAATHRPQAMAAAVPVALGAAAENSAYVKRSKRAAPWSESHRWTLWLALALSVAGVGALAVRTLSMEADRAAP